MLYFITDNQNLNDTLKLNDALINFKLDNFYLDLILKSKFFFLITIFLVIGMPTYFLKRRI